MSHYIQIAIAVVLLLTCGYVGIGLLIEATTQGDDAAIVMSASALAFTWLGLKITYKWYHHPAHD